MLCAIRKSAAALAAGALFFVSGGCKTSRPSPPHNHVSAGTNNEPAPSALSLEKAAQAHASYSEGVLHDLQGDSEMALKDYARAALADPGDEDLVLEVTKRLIQAKQFERALEIASLASGRPHASGAIFARLGMIYSQLGKYDQATEADRTSIRLSPLNFSGYQNLFVNLVQDKKLPEAIAVLDQAAHQKGADAAFLANVATLYVTAGTQEPALRTNLNPKALDVLERARKMKPSDPALRLLLADTFDALGRANRAAELYLELLKNLPDSPVIRERVHAKLAEIYLRQEDASKAMEQLREIVRDDPTNPTPYYWMGRVQLEQHQETEAADNLRRAILLNPDFELAYYELATAELGANKPSEALATLASARQRFPQKFSLEFLSAIAFGAQKAYREAIQHYTSAEIIAQANEPSRLTPDFYFQFGAAYERNGEYKRAEEYFQRCLELSPNNAEALNYLGYMWAEHGMKLEKAQELIQKALKLEPKNAAYLDSLGWVLYKLNQPREALHFELQATQLSKEPDATVFDHLGDIYAALHQADKAREAWQKSLSLEPNDQVRQKLGPEKNQ